MRRIAACLTALALTGSALAGSFTTGAAFRHYSHVAGCGTPISGVTWVANRAYQKFQNCTLRATYQTVGPTRTPTTRPTATPLPTWTSVPTPTAWTWPTPIPTATQPAPSTPEQELLQLVNQHRAAYGSAPLSLISDATTDQHATDMMQDGTIWHTSSNHPATSFPYDGFMGENVGAGQSVQQIDSLMIGEGTGTCSQGTVSHACNIVNPAFRYLAVGIAYGPPYGLYLVEDFR